MRWMAIGAVGLLCLGGCSGRKSSLLLERQARGPISEEPAVAKAVLWHLDPVMQTQTKSGVEVNVNYASREYLKNFFSNKAIFGAYASPTPPYYPEHMVFYIKIANQSDKKIRITPTEFVLIDDRGNQYGTIGTDYVTAFAEYRKPVGSTTRGLLESASPGYFGISLPVGKLIAQKPQGQFALLQQSALQTGFLYPGIVHDGLIAFWNPVPQAKKLRLLITNVKTDLDANDIPRTTLEVAFEFEAVRL